MYSKIRGEMKTGDLISFSGKSRISNLIKWRTRSDISHVGIVYGTELGKTPRVFLMESTGLNNLPDYKTGEFVKGVQLQQLSKRIATYDGQVYWHKLMDHINDTEQDAMLNWLMSTHDKRVPYDTFQAIGAGADLFDSLGLVNEPDFSSLFCSELVCKALQLAKIAPDYLNPSEQTPADVIDYECFDLRIQIA